MGDPTSLPEPSALTDEQMRMLSFERRGWPRAGAKEDAIRAEFGWSVARYYQLLTHLIDEPAALEHDPVLVHRLQRTRDARVGSHAARTFERPDQS